MNTHVLVATFMQLHLRVSGSYAQALFMLILLIMHMCWKDGFGHMSTRLKDARKGVMSPAAGVTGSYDPPNVGAGIRTQILSKNSMHS